jgi:hypothetical protein
MHVVAAAAALLLLAAAVWSGAIAGQTLQHGGRGLQGQHLFVWDVMFNIAGPALWPAL